MKPKTALKVTSLVGLLFTFVPSVLVYKGIMGMQDHFKLMMIGTVIWFTTAPFWMKGPSLDSKSKN